MNLPNSLKINGFDWKIEESGPVSLAAECFGTTHYGTQTIYLDPTMTDQKKKQCLLHGILHAVWWMQGLGARPKDQKLTEEEVIAALSFGLYQVLNDNGLLKF